MQATFVALGDFKVKIITFISDSLPSTFLARMLTQGNAHLNFDCTNRKEWQIIYNGNDELDDMAMMNCALKLH